MLLLALLLNRSWGFWPGDRRNTGFFLCLWFSTSFPSSSFNLGAAAFSANVKLCKGFRDLLEICCEAFYYFFFFLFLPAIGVGVL